jgi:IS5 family transposase
LDDERFIAPWRALFDRRLGRPSVPVEVLLRLLYLKHRYQLGYESLCREVADSIGWRRFCRIGLDGQVPHPTTLVKLLRRAGPEVIAQLNTALLDKLANDRLLRNVTRPVLLIRRRPGRARRCAANHAAVHHRHRDDHQST